MNPSRTMCTLARTHTDLRRPPLRLLGHTIARGDGDTSAESDGDVSPAFLDIQHFVADLDALLAKALGDIEAFDHVVPEIDSRYRRVVRLPDEGGFLIDRVLEITPVSCQTFAVRYYLGDAGFDIPDGVAILYGELVFDGSDRQNCHFTIDLGAAATINPEVAGSGQIRLQSSALPDGGQEIWCDFLDVSDGAGPAETSFTKYRVDGGGSSLEYVVNERTSVSTVAATWSAAGGESTHSLELFDDPSGPIQYATTRRWNPRGVELASNFGFTRGRIEPACQERSLARGSDTHIIPDLERADEEVGTAIWFRPRPEEPADDAAMTSVWWRGEAEEVLASSERQVWSSSDAAATQIFRRQASFA